MRIAVCAKQVPDPDIPPSQFRLAASGRSVESPANVSPVVNGFDLNAIEAAVRIKESAGAETTITVISAGSGFAMDVMKKALATGADDLVLIDDPVAGSLDAAATSRVLAAVIEKNGPFDLVLCGRQASDWDQSHVPVFIAESLGLPLVTVARRIEVTGTGLVVERVRPDGYQEVETELPAVVTVSNELGEPRYPNLRGIMAATRKSPTILALAEIGVDSTDIAPQVELEGLEIPERTGTAEMIGGEDDEEKGRNLAMRLREERII